MPESVISGRQLEQLEHVVAHTCCLVFAIIGEISVAQSAHILSKNCETIARINDGFLVLVVF